MVGLIFLMLICLIQTLIYFNKISNIKELHALEVKAAKDEAYTDGWKDAANKLAIKVQHCNERTRYEMIVHYYNPYDCCHCAEIRDLLA